jgi:dGTPase
MAANLERQHRDHPELLALAGGLDPVVVEAAALAHDLGHPPFGHVAEAALHRMLKDRTGEGFEGNAQTFRILTRLAIRDDTYRGLNLTRATLAAVLKYPWLEGDTGLTRFKWGAYRSEAADLHFSRNSLRPAMRDAVPPDVAMCTLESRLMDWADDIAYAIHDVEDFFRVGVIPLDRLRSDDAERARFLQYHLTQRVKPGSGVSEADIRDIGDALLYKSSPFDEPYSGSIISRAKLHRRSSAFIHRYILSVDLVEQSNAVGWELVIDPVIRIEVELLKSLLWFYMSDNRQLLSLRFGYAMLIESLFEHLDTAIQRQAFNIFPEYFREELESCADDGGVYRVIADFIASLTEAQAVDLHHRLSGIVPGSGE